MTNKVLTSTGGCGCGQGLGGIALQPPGSGGGSANIIVRHKHGCVIGNVIYEYNEGGVKVYELDDLILSLPVVALTNDAPAKSEIGVTIPVVTFSGSITQGTWPITSRSLTPDPGGVDLSGPFLFQKINVKRTTPGTAENHTLSATDSEGNSKSATSGVVFKHAFYQGFNALTSLNETQIKTLVNKTLNDSIIQQYGGEQDYTNPLSTPKYIYWCGPIGTTAIAGAMLSGLALPLLELAPVSVINIHDGSIVTPYWVKRSANLFDPGTYKITLS